MQDVLITTGTTVLFLFVYLIFTAIAIGSTLQKEKGRFNPAISCKFTTKQCAYKQINYIVDQYYIIGLQFQTEE